jgi:hypothetical protein
MKYFMKFLEILWNSQKFCETLTEKSSFMKKSFMKYFLKFYEIRHAKSLSVFKVHSRLTCSTNTSRQIFRAEEIPDSM